MTIPDALLLFAVVASVWLVWVAVTWIVAVALQAFSRWLSKDS